MLRLRITALVTVLALSILPSLADSDVLLLGVSEYKSKKLSKLNIQKDFEGLEATFKGLSQKNQVIVQRKPFTRDEFLKLFDLTITPVKPDLEKITLITTRKSNFPITERKNNQLIVYIAGHGMQVNDAVFLMTSGWEGDPSKSKDLVPIDIIRRRAGMLGYERVCVITDICRTTSSQVNIEWELLKPKAKAVYVLHGTQDGKPAAESDGGVFTRFSIKALEDAKKADITLDVYTLDQTVSNMMKFASQASSPSVEGDPTRYPFIFFQGTKDHKLPIPTPILDKFVDSLVTVNAGEFQMGSNDPDENALPHQVFVSAFKMSKTPITVALWKEYCEDNAIAMPKSPEPPVRGWEDENPIVNVSWLDIMGRDGMGASSTDGFCAWVMRRKDIALTLPTEAQFEFAARQANPKSKFPWGENFQSESLWNSTAKTGDSNGTANVFRKSNIYAVRGLTDMIGNVRQWCLDWFGEYSSTSQLDPSGPKGSKLGRVVRGNSWRGVHPKDRFTVTFRDNHLATYIADDLGFRLVTTRVQEPGTSKWALVRFLGLPPGAEVRVDQKKVDGNAFSELLSASEKTVTLYIKAKGFYEYQQRITLVAAQTQDIDVNLKPLPRLNEFPAVRKYVERLKNIPKGTFEMGSNRFKGSPVHMVTLDAFRLGETPVTVAMWKEYCKDTNVPMPPKPNWGWIDNHPVVNVSWNDIMGLDGRSGFCKWVSDIAGIKLTLPTEAQFEYAARAGKKGDVFPWGDKFEKGRSFNGWLLTGGVDRSYDIYRNGFGLADMSGNVYQWCSDYFHELSEAAQVNPSGPTESSSGQRIARGGSWFDKDKLFMLCCRRSGFDSDKRYDNFGFRLMAGPK